LKSLGRCRARQGKRRQDPWRFGPPRLLTCKKVAEAGAPWGGSRASKIRPPKSRRPGTRSSPLRRPHCCADEYSAKPPSHITLWGALSLPDVSPNAKIPGQRFPFLLIRVRHYKPCKKGDGIFVTIVPIGRDCDNSCVQCCQRGGEKKNAGKLLCCGLRRRPDTEAHPGHAKWKNGPIISWSR